MYGIYMGYMGFVQYWNTVAGDAHQSQVVPKVELPHQNSTKLAFSSSQLLSQVVNTFSIYRDFLNFNEITSLERSDVRFLKDTMNIIDMVAICPFYISLILEGLEDFEIIGKTGKIIRLVRQHCETQPPASIG